MSQPRSPFHAPEHILSRKLDDEMVLLNLDSGEYFGLNDTGARVWEMLVDGHTPEEVVDRLTDEFEVTPEAAGEHVVSLCGELVEAGLLAQGGTGEP